MKLLELQVQDPLYFRTASTTTLRMEVNIQNIGKRIEYLALACAYLGFVPPLLLDRGGGAFLQAPK